MNYELAKELKDAGFPQKLCSFSDCRHGMDEGIECAYVPTLSELIEACRGSSHAQFKLSWKRVFKNWRASVYNEGTVYGDGSTSQEAVAHLWIALNTT